MNWKTYLPIAQWLPEYKRSYLTKDLMAGLTVGIVLVPQGMAYAMIAGLPPIYGLYAGIVPMFLYSLFGTSRQLSVGPVALVSLLVLSGLSNYAEAGSETFIAMAIATSLLAGLFQVLLGVFRLGFMVNFLSHPVVSGFTSAAAILIIFSQLRNLSGIPIDQSNHIQYILADLVDNMRGVHWLTLLMGVGSVVFLLVMRRISPRIPAALLIIIIGIMLTQWLALKLDIVGPVPKGLPGFNLPFLSIDVLIQILPLSLTIGFISFVESIAIAKTMDSRNEDQPQVDPNQELIALGICKIGGSFFQSYPSTGSFSRSAINESSGAKTSMASIFAALLLVLVLLFFTSWFYYLPKAVLAAITVVSVLGLFDYREAIYLWRTDRRDWLILLTTFAVTLTFGIQPGILAGVILSLALMVYHNSKPHVAVLGRIPDTRYFRNIKRFPDAIQYSGMMVVRFDAQLYFGNATYFLDTIKKLVIDHPDRIDIIVLDASSIHDIDSSGIQVLQRLHRWLQERHTEFALAGVIGPVRDLFHKAGLIDEIGEENFFMYVYDAVNVLHSSTQGNKEDWTSKAIQTNVDERSH